MARTISVNAGKVKEPKKRFEVIHAAGLGSHVLGKEIQPWLGKNMGFALNKCIISDGLSSVLFILRIE